MKLPKLLLFLCLSLSVCLSFSQDKSQESYELNNYQLDKKIAAITDQYENIPGDFLRMIIQNREYIADSTISYAQKVFYQNRLINFLEKPLEKELIYKGRYTSVLRYNLFVIKWTEQNTLAENLLLYPNISLRALPLYVNDSAAYIFLDSMVNLIPEEVIRNSEVFQSTWYAEKIWSKLATKAPGTIKRYFTARSVLSIYLYTSEDTVISMLREMHNRFGLKSKAHYFLDEIISNNMSLNEADSLASDNNLFFSQAVASLKKNTPIGLYTIRRELEHLCINIARSLSLKSDDTSYDFVKISEYSKEEILALMCYGKQDFLTMDLDYLITVLNVKGSRPVSSQFLKNLPKQKLADLILYVQSKNIYYDFTQALGNENQEYLRLVSTYEMPDLDLSPDKKGIRFLQINSSANRPVTMIHEAEEASDEIPIADEENSISLKKESKSLAPKNKYVEDVLIGKTIPIELQNELELIQPMSFELSDEEKKLMRLMQNTYESIQRISQFVDEPYARAFLEYAAAKEPDEILKMAWFFKSKPYSLVVLEKAALNAPVSAKKYLFNPAHPVSVILKYSSNNLIQKMISFNEPTTYKTKPYLLINEMANNKMTPEQAVSISSNPDLLFKEMVKTVSQKGTIGSYSIEKEMSYYSLQFIRAINDKIQYPDNVRFATLDNVSVEELYMITVFGREEVFNSTFTGIFSRVESNLAKASPSYIDKFILLPKFRTFIALCAINNKLTKLFSYFSASQKENCIKNFVGGLDSFDGSFEEAVTLSETIANTNDAQIITLLQQNIKQEYMRCDSLHQNKCMVVYGILAGLVKEKAVIEVRWFDDMSKRYPAAELTTLKIQSLIFNGQIVERMYFYDDDDGRDSYVNFTNLFRTKENWRVEEHYSYVRVFSTKGVPIEIYANKPSFQDGGEQAISTIFMENQYVPSIVIHRGHSFHTERTLEKIPSSTKLIFIGSCGGFYKASIGLKNAPDAHIVATKQIGTKQINDPMIYAINESLRQGADIQWPSFWNRMKIQLGSYSLFYDYVPPHKNIEALFQNAYYKTLGL